MSSVPDAMRSTSGDTAAALGCGALLVVLLLIPAVLTRTIDGDGDGSRTRPARTEPKPDHGDVHGAWAYMQLFVEKELKAPKTADFPFGGYRHVTYLGSGRYRVNSYVDAENSFGAMIRTEFEGIIRRASGGWELESLRFK